MKISLALLTTDPSHKQEFIITYLVFISTLNSLNSSIFTIAAGAYCIHEKICNCILQKDLEIIRHQVLSLHNNELHNKSVTITSISFQMEVFKMIVLLW